MNIKKAILLSLAITIGYTTAVSFEVTVKEEDEIAQVTSTSCCQLGKKIAKHGRENCNWTSSLVLRVQEINNQWSHKSPVTGAEPSKKTVNLSLLRRCGRQKKFFAKCCLAEVKANRRFLKQFYKLMSKLTQKLKSRIEGGGKRYDQGQLKKPKPNF